jgi:dipeptidyl aminopeptidase/acylaminoacyl peptidase
MSQRSFGPWATGLGDEVSPALSTFWRRRLGRLAAIRREPATLSRRDCLRLGAAGLAAAALPGVRLAPALGATASAMREAKIYVPIELSGPNGKTTGVAAIEPETGAWRIVVDKAVVPWVRVSPDGKRLVTETGESYPKTRREVWVCDTSGEADPVKLDLGDLNPAEGTGRILDPPFWTHDGKRLVTHVWWEDKGRYHTESWRFDADGKNPEKLPFPDDESPEDVSPDGTLFLLVDYVEPGGDAQNRASALVVRNADGSGRRVVVSGPGAHDPARFSPDGKKVAYLHWKNPDRRALWVVGLDGKDPAPLIREELAQPDSVCWSPDGKWLAVQLQAFKRKGDGTLDFDNDNSRIELVSADGRERKSIPKPPNTSWFGSPDWR